MWSGGGDGKAKSTDLLQEFAVHPFHCFALFYLFFMDKLHSKIIVNKILLQNKVNILLYLLDVLNNLRTLFASLY